MRKTWDDRLAEAFDTWAIKEPEPIVEWVADNVYFDPKICATSGYWDHMAFPYSREVLEALANPDVREVVALWATQLGKTSILGAYVAWVMANCPRPLLIACPNEKSCHEHRDTRLIPFLKMVESLKGQVPAKHRMTRYMVPIGEGLIYYSWSGSPSTVSGRSAKTVLITEVNLHAKGGKRGEGDPVSMARDRIKAFPDGKIYIEGKPVDEEECRTTAAYKDTDQRTFHVPCPKCGKYQKLELGRKDETHGLRWSKDRRGDVIPKSVEYCCRHCSMAFRDSKRSLIMLRGIWVPKGCTAQLDEKLAKPVLIGTPDRGPTKTGFQLSSLYSPVVPWQEYAEEFVRASRAGLDEFKAFIQGWEGIASVANVQVFDRDVIGTHILDYRQGDRMNDRPVVPSDDFELIGAVDMQQDSFYYVLRAFEPGATSFLVEQGHGLRTGGNLDALGELMLRTYVDKDGRPVFVKKWMVDCGYDTQAVLEFCATRPRVCQAIRGGHQYRQLAILRATTIMIRSRGHRGTVWVIDKGKALDYLYRNLLQVTKGMRGYWGIPQDVDPDYIVAMAAWRKKRVAVNKIAWVSTDEINEHYGDCESYLAAYAAYADYQRKQPRSRTVKQPVDRSKDKDFIPDVKDFIPDLKD